MDERELAVEKNEEAGAEVNGTVGAQNASEEDGAVKEEAMADGETLEDLGNSANEADNGPRAEQALAAVTEVGILMWILLSSVKFKMPHFTLGALESGLRNPTSSEVLNSMHSILLLDDDGLAKIRKANRGPNVRMPYEWWTTELYNTVRLWVQNRRELAFELKVMENSEDESYQEDKVEWFKSNIEELDDLLKPLLLGEIPEMATLPTLEELEERENLASAEEKDSESNDNSESNDLVAPVETAREKKKRLESELDRLEQEQNKKEDALVDKIMPFMTSDDYAYLTPEQRLGLLQALCKWRANGHPEPSVLETLRAFEPDSLRQPPLGEDHLGRRYWYFPQFYQDCRIYRETLHDEREKAAEEARIKAEAKQKDLEEKRKLEEEQRKKEEEESKIEEDKKNDEMEVEVEKESKSNGKKGKANKKKSGKNDRKKAPDDDDDSLQRMLELESGRRTSSRQRTQVQRFHEEQAQQLLTATPKKKKEAPRPSASTSKKSKATKNGKKRRRSGKPVAESSEDDEDEDDDSSAETKGRKSRGKMNKSKTAKNRRPIVNGPELPPKEWKLICWDLESLHGVVKELKEFEDDENEFLLEKLDSILAELERQEENIKRAQARVEKLEKFQTMPRKRSSRVQAIEEKKKVKEEEDKVRLEQLQALEEERQEQKRQADEARKLKEREMRAQERDLQRQLEEQRRDQRVAARDVARVQDDQENVETEGQPVDSFVQVNELPTHSSAQDQIAPSLTLNHHVKADELSSAVEQGQEQVVDQETGHSLDSIRNNEIPNEVSISASLVQQDAPKEVDGQDVTHPGLVE